jgi:excisionase family DNA binding protein
VSTVVHLPPSRYRKAERPSQTAQESAVYTVKEVAALLRLSLGSTYALVREGEIPAKKMGGRWVVPKRRFHAWLDECADSSEDQLWAESGLPFGNRKDGR